MRNCMKRSNVALLILFFPEILLFQLCPRKYDFRGKVRRLFMSEWIYQKRDSFGTVGEFSSFWRRNERKESLDSC